MPNWWCRDCGWFPDPESNWKDKGPFPTGPVPHPCNLQNGYAVPYLRGYCDALLDFGIWKNGTQTIGCLETPVHIVMERQAKKHGLTTAQLYEILK